MNTYWYLATAYSKHPGGLEEAFRMACRAAGLLMQAKVPVFSPIAHTHPISVVCDMNPLDHGIWLPIDQPMIDAAHGIIVLMEGGWEESFGVQYELDCFLKRGKTVVFMREGRLPLEFALRPVAA